MPLDAIRHRQDVRFFLRSVILIIFCSATARAFLSIPGGLHCCHVTDGSQALWKSRNSPTSLATNLSSSPALKATAERRRGFASIKRSRSVVRPTLKPSTTGSDDNIPVKIISPSPNSRTILGTIYIPSVTVDDVWSILTDYDRLSVHVPNLVESIRRNDDGGTPAGSGKNGAGCAGDGSYRCRLYQRGAQKIVGFTFGASVTMTMEEKVIEGYIPASVSGLENGRASLFPVARNFMRDRRNFESESFRGGGGRIERHVMFKCVDSRFFGAFDGQWKVIYDPLSSTDGVFLEYEVFVKPKGPVPVAALEWRIKEDVPINLQAVKRASVDVGMEGVMDHRTRGQWSKIVKAMERGNNESRDSGLSQTSGVGNQIAGSTLMDKVESKNSRKFSNEFFAGYRPLFVDWEEDETMAKYLPRKKNN